MHEVLVNRLGGLSLPRKSVVRLTDRPDMTLDVYRGRKTTMQLIGKKRAAERRYKVKVDMANMIRITAGGYWISTIEPVTITFLLAHLSTKCSW